jgi:hypothetical protein
LKLVQEIKLQNSGHHIPEVVRAGALTENLLNGKIATSDPENQDDPVLGHDSNERQFELEVYSTPHAWVAKFCEGSEQGEEVPILSEEWHMVNV